MFVIIFLARVLSLPKKLLHIVRNKIKKESSQMVKKKLLKVKKCHKNAQKTQKF